MVLVSYFRQPQDLPTLCTIVFSSLWVQHQTSNKQLLWDDSRRLELHTYCQSLLSYLNVSPSVVYTSLMYVQKYLVSLPPTIRTDQLVYGSERGIFTISLLLAYKFVEDCGSVDTRLWSQVSMIPVPSLRKMEIDFLCHVDHRLHVDKAEFARWVTQCNAIFDQSLYLCSLSTIDGGLHDAYFVPLDKSPFLYAYPTTIVVQEPQCLVYPCYYGGNGSGWYHKSQWDDLYPLDFSAATTAVPFAPNFYQHHHYYYPATADIMP
ncbi:hypothetical protein BX666DRAFT_1999855 [Dichotomocladium elegans]|nr:hypothetical protein BX666DRAFT_1999855 [Dichotomocladium elegans]